MFKKNKSKNSFEFYYIKWTGITTVRLLRIWIKIHRKTTYLVDFERPLDPDEYIVMASNHQQLLDPLVIFGALDMSDLIKITPVKFMTWHKYYNSIFKFPLYSMGCYPTHEGKYAGVPGAIHFSKMGYNNYLFPEGKRTDPKNRGKVYEGISRLLDSAPKTRFILIFVDWEPRKSFFSRPKLLVHFFDAPKNIDKTNPVKIMDAIYANNQ